MNNENGNTGDWEEQLAAALNRSSEIEVDAPPFDAVFAAAERRYGSSKRQYAGGLAGAAMVAAVAVAVMLVFSADAPTPTLDPMPRMLHVAELMDSTDWSAPSDVLLPTHEFDIYQELPVLLESTKPAEGALL